MALYLNLKWTTYSGRGGLVQYHFCNLIKLNVNSYEYILVRYVLRLVHRLAACMHVVRCTERRTCWTSRTRRSWRMRRDTWWASSRRARRRAASRWSATRATRQGSPGRSAASSARSVSCAIQSPTRPTPLRSRSSFPRTKSAARAVRIHLLSALSRMCKSHLTTRSLL